MDMLASILVGIQVCMQPQNILLCFLGVLTGTLIGVLPGIGTVGAMAILFPLTYGITPVGAIIMLSGIYYGAQYGGSITSILTNIPGESTSIVTCLDGHQMARNGRAGPALGMSALASFIGASLVIVLMMFVSAPLARLALLFGPPEYFALLCLGLVILSGLIHGSMSKGVMMVLLGLLLGTVGMDMYGNQRFTFNSYNLLDGIGLVPMIMGIFGVAEVIASLEEPVRREMVSKRLRDLLPTRADWARSRGAIARGSIIGFFLGLLPGGGALIASFAAYAVEKRVSKHPEKFGTGMIEGVAAPEAANNAGAQASFLPLLSLGIPTNVVMAVLFGGLLVHNIQPGPMLVADHPEIFWGVIMSMYMGNIMLLILNLPLIGLWVRLLSVPYRALFPFVLFFCLVGVYATDGNPSDVYVLVIFGFIGYVMKKFGFEPAPFVLAFVISGIIEVNFRQSLILSDGSLTIFFTRPLSAVFMVCATGFLVARTFQLLAPRRVS